MDRTDEQSSECIMIARPAGLAAGTQGAANKIAAALFS
jgi:hypothetical protein